MYKYPRYNSNGDRFFAFPFLVGALTGGAAVGLTRPRPIYNTMPYRPMNPYMPYGNYSYSYYYPTYPQY
jgi:hypothetical protein